LDVDSELRFEVEGKGVKVTVELADGVAEMFGTELVKGKSYVFGAGAKVAIFTWHGASVKVSGKTDVIYVADETPMVQYLNAHGALEERRRQADKKKRQGPVTLVCGPASVGKSTLCRLLANYAVRLDRRPIYVDLDVTYGSISMPGSLGAMLIERPASVEEGFHQQAPLVYHYGHMTPQQNPTLYNLLVTKLAQCVQDRLSANKKSRSSGVIINTHGWIKGEGYTLLQHIAAAFKVDVVIVLDQERLYNELKRDMPKDICSVLYLPKSGGVVERSVSLKGEARDARVREYFYGASGQLFPQAFDVKFSDLKVYKIGAPNLPSSCMPLGMKAEDNHTKLVPVAVNVNLLNHVLAVSFAMSPDEDVLRKNVAGFICITAVDPDRQVVTVLSPQQQPLPPTLLILSDVQFMDSH